ncbi:MAG: ribosome small subunit-dependent GTPase A, partial [Clostridia bacterium]|nr:ribosome small subunit-dependent GTPase A [Clostridia bacterium]
KTDLGAKLCDYVQSNYLKAVYALYFLSAETGEGVEDLKAAIRGKFAAFAGQSAVGKTSLINRIFNKEERVNELSEKTLRGRHTTTARTIHIEGDFMITDTPGFSSSQEFSVESFDLPLYYKEFEPYNGKCYYIGCSHIAEPDCLVKDALSRGDISEDRYKRYVVIYKEIKEYEKRKY